MPKSKPKFTFPTCSLPHFTTRLNPRSRTQSHNPDPQLYTMGLSNFANIILVSILLTKLNRVLAPGSCHWLLIHIS